MSKKFFEIVISCPSDSTIFIANDATICAALQRELGIRVIVEHIREVPFPDPTILPGAIPFITFFPRETTEVAKTDPSRSSHS
jgi:hypothetical protein